MSNFLNFSEAMNHLRWGERVARRNWNNGTYLHINYDVQPNSLTFVTYNGVVANDYPILSQDVLAEDWYVLNEHQ